MAGQFQTRNVPAGTTANRMSAQMPKLGMTAKEMTSIIRRHLLLIVLMTTIGTVIGSGSWFLCRKYAPKYTAQALIEVLTPGITDPDTFQPMAPNRDMVYSFRQSKAYSLKRSGNLRKLLRESDAIRETSWFGLFGNNEIKRLEDLNKNLGAVAQRETNYLIISMKCGSASDAALITNEMVKLFLGVEEQQAKGDIRAQLAKRNSQLESLQEQLRGTENTLDGIRQGTEFANLDSTAGFRSYLDGKLEDVESRSNETATRISRLETMAEIIRKRAQGSYDDLIKAQADSDTTGISLRLRIIELEMLLAERLTHLGENHRQIKENRDALKQTQKELDDRVAYIADLVRQSQLVQVQDQLISVTAERDTLEKQRIEARQEYKAVSLIRADYMKQAAQRDKLRVTIADAEIFIRKLNAVHDDPTANKMRLVSLAMPPDRMSSPNITIFIPGGFVLGFMLGIGLTFLIEILNDLVRMPHDVIRYLRVPLLGTICHKSEDASIRKVDLCHVVQQAPYSITSECYRQLRTNLKLITTSGSHKSLLVTSAATKDGKTTTAVNLCYALIADNCKVVLIDTNFHKPSTVNLFPKTVENDISMEASDRCLSNCLMGQCDIGEVVRTSGIEGLSIVDSGQTPLHTAELLGSSRMKNIIDELSNKYDYVIIDGPPLLVSEAKMLAATTDGTIVVFNAMSTRRGTAQRTLRELHEINANLIGTVLIGIRSMKGGYFREIYRSYQEYQDAAAKSHATLSV